MAVLAKESGRDRLQAIAAPCFLIDLVTFVPGWKGSPAKTVHR